MIIRSIRHKGLRLLIENDDPSGLPAQFADKLRNMIGFLQDMGSEAELRTVPTWKAHRLSGGREGTWSLFVSRNWRLTFRIDRKEVEILALDFEDYH